VQAHDATQNTVPLRDFAAHTDRPVRVRVRFTVRNAKLYAMWVG